MDDWSLLFANQKRTRMSMLTKNSAKDECFKLVMCGPWEIAVDRRRRFFQVECVVFLPSRSIEVWHTSTHLHIKNHLLWLAVGCPGFFVCTLQYSTSSFHRFISNNIKRWEPLVLCIENHLQFCILPSSSVPKVPFLPVLLSIRSIIERTSKALYIREKPRRP